MDAAVGLVRQVEALEDSELLEYSIAHFDSDSHRLAFGENFSPRALTIALGARGKVAGVAARGL
jgi:hypothetical protein